MIERPSTLTRLRRIRRRWKLAGAGIVVVFSASLLTLALQPHLAEAQPRTLFFLRNGGGLTFAGGSSLPWAHQPTRTSVQLPKPLPKRAVTQLPNANALVTPRVATEASPSATSFQRQDPDSSPRPRPADHPPRQLPLLARSPSLETAPHAHPQPLPQLIAIRTDDDQREPMPSKMTSSISSRQTVTLASSRSGSAARISSPAAAGPRRHAGDR